jgi:hypothetical protein
MHSGLHGRVATWMSRWNVAAVALGVLLVAASGAKLLRLDAVARDCASLASSLGLGAVPTESARILVLALVAVELLIAAVLVAASRRRVGLLLVLGLMSGGIALIGHASAWGTDPDIGCPCGLAIAFPLLENAFSLLLLRDAALVALVAIAWPADHAA